MIKQIYPNTISKEGINDPGIRALIDEAQQEWNQIPDTVFDSINRINNWALTELGFKTSDCEPFICGIILTLYVNENGGPALKLICHQNNLWNIKHYDSTASCHSYTEDGVVEQHYNLQESKIKNILQRKAKEFKLL